MRKFLIPIMAALPLAAGGCIAKTVVDVVTLPVKAGAQAADWATTSQDESDRNYGRKMRKQEEAEGKERRKRDEACRKDRDKCVPSTRDEPEIDRYCSAPGQACSYKMGEIAITGLREELKRGPNFDLKRFHSAVLDGGRMPLTVLERRVRTAFA